MISSSELARFWGIWVCVGGAVSALGCGASAGTAGADDESVSANSTVEALTPPTGVLERAFVTDGIVNAVSQANGSIYIGGKFGYVGQRSGGFAALSSSAAQRDRFWPELGGGLVDAIVSDGQGGFFLGGDFKLAGTVPVRSLAHVRVDGTVDPAFTVPVNGRVFALAFDGNTLFVGGHFSTVGGAAHNLIAAIDIPTHKVTTWNPALPNTAPTTGFAPAVRSISVADGVVYAAGTSFGVHSEALRAIDEVTGATVWIPSFGANYSASVVSGSTLFLGATTQSHALIAVDRATGAQLPWDAGIQRRASLPAAEVHALAIAGQTLYVGGEFGFAGGAPRYGAAAFDLTTLTVTPFDPNVEQVVHDSNHIPSFVESLSVQGDTVYLGGGFERVDGVDRIHLAAVDATTGKHRLWHIAAPRRTECVAGFTDGTCANVVFAVQASTDTVFVGGDFTSIGGVERENLAALDAITRRVTAWAPSVPGGVVQALDFAGGRVYVGGQFSTVNALPRQALVSLDPSTGAVLNPAFDLAGTVNTLAHTDTILYVGGTFTSLTGAARSNLAAYTSTTADLLPWAPTPNHGVSALTLSGSAVYVAGDFDTISGQPDGHLAALDGTSGALLPFSGPFGAPGATGVGGAWSLAVDGSTLYVAGPFIISSPLRNGLAAFNAATGGLRTWAPQLGASARITPQVRSLALSGHTVYLGGAFNAVNGTARADLAAVDASGALTPFAHNIELGDARATGEVWSGFFSAPSATNNPQIRGLYALSVLGNRLATGGNFVSVDNQDQSGFARFEIP